MCLILLAWRAHPEYPLVFGGNRDEAYARPSIVADFWKEAPLIFGGRDLEKGGTWLGLTRAGRIAAVTNYRDGPAARDDEAHGISASERAKLRALIKELGKSKEGV